MRLLEVFRKLRRFRMDQGAVGCVDASKRPAGGHLSLPKSPNLISFASWVQFKGVQNAAVHDVDDEEFA